MEERIVTKLDERQRGGVTGEAREPAKDEKAARPSTTPFLPPSQDPSLNTLVSQWKVDRNV